MRYCKNAACRVMTYLTSIVGEHVDQSCPGCGKIGDRT